jgi:hypothetical protein
MDTYDAIASTQCVLNEQIAHRVFDALPERGPIVAIMDRTGRCWPSDPQEFARLNLSAALLAELRAKVDDGAEPVFAHAGDTSITAAQLATENTACGYLFIAIPRCGAELTQIHLDLLESLLSQITLVATLVERNHALNELRAKQLGACGSGEAVAN